MVDSALNLKEIGDLYGRLMQEIKNRIQVVQDVLEPKYPLPEIVAVELCYLQFRKICELLAFSCLTANAPNIAEMENIFPNKIYRADMILKKLESVHAEFFPIAAKEQYAKQSGTPVLTPDEEKGALTKKEVSELYYESDEYLHRGRRRLIATDWVQKIDLDRIAAWRKKIIKLLEYHWMKTMEPNQYFRVWMQGKDGKVHWEIGMLEANTK